MVHAGFYEADITPALGMERPATYYKLYHETIRDPLKVRACVLDDGVACLAVVGLDAGLVQSRTVQRAREVIEARYGIPAGNILVAASHTHSGGPLSGNDAEDFRDAPELIRRLALDESVCQDAGYERHVIGQIVTAVGMANASKCPARLSVGRGSEGAVSFNRRFRLRNGCCATHPGRGNPEIVAPAGPIDPDVGVIAAWDEAGALLGCIVNFACHATCNAEDGVSADYIGEIERTLRGVMGAQAKLVFLNGASGDITQVDNQSLRPREKGGEWLRRVGIRIGAEAVKVLVSAEKGRDFKLAALSETLVLDTRRPSADSLERARELCARILRKPIKTTEFHFAKERLLLEYSPPVRELELQALQIGPAVILATPAELFCQHGLDIKAGSTFPYTFVAGLANGAFGYVPTEDAFDLAHGGGYETVLTSISNLEPGAGRKIVDGCLVLAGRLVPGEEPRGEHVEPSNVVWDFGALGPELE